MTLREKTEPLFIRLAELTQLLGEPEVIADTGRWQALAQEHARLQEITELYAPYAKLDMAVTEAKAELESADPELVELAKEELPGLLERLEQAKAALEEAMVPPDPEDSKNVVLEIRAGTGGEEASLFAMDLFRMYTRYADRKGWKTEVLTYGETELGGLKEAVCLITGNRVYRLLKYESGVHRVQRVPETESQGRIHTSAATVAVLPEAEDVEVTLEAKDLIIETHRSTGAGGQHINKTESAVRMVHIPTGIVVSCQDEKSQIKNREKALKVMKTRVLDYYRSASQAEYAASRKSQIGSGDRSERIRTYNFPQGRVTDHRIGLTLYNLPAVLAGDMDALTGALVQAAAREESV